MSRDKAGRVHWIDHYTIPTNDLDLAIDFHERILGARTNPSPVMRERGRLFQYMTRSLHGLFVQKLPLPAREPLGAGYPRHAWFVLPEDLPLHLKRLDANHVEHSGPVPDRSHGVAGTSVCWYDAEGNQLEFWAPERMPEGAMTDCGPLRIGRISHGVYASRDLARTAAFFRQFCDLEPLANPLVAPDALVLPLAAGARLVFRQVAEPGPRTSGRGRYNDIHTALVVAERDFWPNYERIWDQLPEWSYNQLGPYEGDGARLPARTGLHGSPAGRAFRATFGRGDDWFDWDTNMFHFVGGEPDGADPGSLALYKGHTVDHYVDAYLAGHPRGPDRGSV